ncbi:aromatic ring-hydroxylating oxygenase subunit alpha [Pseudoalteromonas obscura]|uniref:Aromatic ring-hydroxylating dioxygenase subunit alpha n=1 Tax=Pseudoalteromonas obscura TaxID=3048491 RepID=A0ABT7ETJ9_9GAMM|nr:aromatic ring-hydroxylating dioxygenase subunit alpha [Pseudoalteromonas sp. P94(2023)]MDK2598384.1 aromatic ring-hydroxylating dioxygenase subunit alpha [Pseudoalteromonas sp. P94(2023)]
MNKLAPKNGKYTSYQDVIATDKIAPPEDMHMHSSAQYDFHSISKARYTEVEYHDLEMKKVWSRVWQMACRVEDIPEEGDTYVYEIGHLSLIVVRVSDDEPQSLSETKVIKAYYNSCRHRGRKLVEHNTSVQCIRCPYHGFTWSLEGELTEIPYEWDFSKIEKKSMPLLEVRVDVWDGFVFINMDPDAESLKSYLEILPEQLANNFYGEQVVVKHSQQVLPANWKTVMESFMEGLHAQETHGHTWAHLSDILQYDTFPGVRHISRSFHAVGLQVSEGREKLTEQEIMDHFHYNVHLGNPDTPPPQLGQGVTARQYMADIMRAQHTLKTGKDHMHLSDAEALDVLQYTLFPNIILFRGITLPIILRFRPNKNDHSQCIFDIFFLEDKPKSEVESPAVETVHMAAGDTYEEAGVLEDWLGHVYDQDMVNIENMHGGLLSGPDQEVYLSDYHESRIKHFHHALNLYMNKELGGE